MSLLIHEATDAYMPPDIDPHQKTGRNRTHESVKAKAIEKGHSTPAMAGEFARRIRAERLVLNHIGARYPTAPSLSSETKVCSIRFPAPGRDTFRVACMRELERQAFEAWRPKKGEVVAAYDYCRVEIPPNASRTEAHSSSIASTTGVEITLTIMGPNAPDVNSERQGVVVANKHVEILRDERQCDDHSEGSRRKGKRRREEDRADYGSPRSRSHWPGEEGRKANKRRK